MIASKIQAIGRQDLEIHETLEAKKRKLERNNDNIHWQKSYKTYNHFTYFINHEKRQFNGTYKGRWMGVYPTGMWCQGYYGYIPKSVEQLFAKRPPAPEINTSFALLCSSGKQQELGKFIYIPSFYMSLC